MAVKINYILYFSKLFTKVFGRVYLTETHLKFTVVHFKLPLINS